MKPYVEIMHSESNAQIYLTCILLVVMSSMKLNDKDAKVLIRTADKLKGF